MYYLQSRYYDADIGRFVNEDDANYIESLETVNYHCLYTYCENNPINKTDDTGFSTTKVVGYGLQIELGIGWASFGIELIWYTSSSIRNGRAWYIPYAYLYGGGGLSQNLTNIISKITKNPSLIFNPKKLTSASLSISIFAIFAYIGKFKKPKDYAGYVNSTSVTLWNVKTYTSWSSTCFVIGVGVSTAKFSASSGFSFCQLSSKLFRNLSNVYNNVAKKAKTIR